MTAREKAAKIASLRKQVVQAEAKLGDLREALAKLERDAGDAAPLSGLDMLWNEALPKSRERSSRHQCRLEWHRLAKADRPKIEAAIAALRAWNRCEQWTKDANAYVPGLHQFIKRRLWEDVPQVRDPLARYRPAKPAAPAAPPAAGELADAEDVASILGSLTRTLRTT